VLLSASPANSPTVSDRLAAKPNLSGISWLDNGKVDKMIVGRENGRKGQV
jgi:hypothetical protein